MSAVFSARARVGGAERAAAVVLQRLNKLAPLDEAAEAVITGLSAIQTYRPLAELAIDSQQAPKASFLVSGWAARARILPDGRRQLFGFVLPGDAIGICQRPHPLALTSTIALTPVQTLSARPLENLCEARVPPRLRSALHVSASMHEAYLLNQVMRLGRLTAYERTCHLFLELRDRLKLVGLATDDRLAMPLTQEVLADANGLSTVHVNRVLQQLRRDKLLTMNSGEVVLLDAEAMAVTGHYVAPEPSRWA